MDMFSLLSNFMLTLLLAGIGLLVLGRLSGWWLLALAGAFSLVSTVLGPSRGLGRMALPAVLDAALLTGAALLGAWTWQQVLAGGRRVAPLGPGRRTRAWVLGGSAAALAAVLLHVLVNPSAALPAGMVGLAAGLTAVGLVALAQRWRLGFLLLAAAQVVAGVQLAVALPGLFGRLTTPTAGTLLLPSVVQVVGICLLSLWGWRSWGSRERTRAAGTAYA